MQALDARDIQFLQRLLPLDLQQILDKVCVRHYCGDPLPGYGAFGATAQAVLDNDATQDLQWWVRLDVTDGDLMTELYQALYELAVMIETDVQEGLVLPSPSPPRLKIVSLQPCAREGVTYADTGR